MSLHYKNREVSLPFIMQYYPNLKSQPVGDARLATKTCTQNLRYPPNVSLNPCFLLN
jgi:hypothetical protein